MLVSALEHSADRPRDDRIGYAESRLDAYIVAHDAATGIVQQRAFVPPDAVPPTRGGLTKASPVWQGDEFNAVAVDWNEAQPELPKHRSAGLPEFGIEARTVSWVSIAKERRNLLVDASYGRHRRPNFLAARPQGAIDGQVHAAQIAPSRCLVCAPIGMYEAVGPGQGCLSSVLGARARVGKRRPCGWLGLPSVAGVPSRVSRLRGP